MNATIGWIALAAALAAGTAGAQEATLFRDDPGYSQHDRIASSAAQAERIAASNGRRGW